MRERSRLYLITPPGIDDAFDASLAAALAAGDVAAVQLRLKDIPDADILRIGERIKPIVQNAGAAFILNDRPDLAAILGADGVHIGQGDGPYAEARALMGKDKTIGVTCHASKHLAMEAAEAGADYIAFGAFFPTQTKDAPIRAELDLLTWWQEAMEIPCVAIGGITNESAETVARAGADFIAVSAGVWAHRDGPAAAVAAFNQALDRAHAP